MLLYFVTESAAHGLLMVRHCETGFLNLNVKTLISKHVQCIYDYFKIKKSKFYMHTVIFSVIPLNIVITCNVSIATRFILYS